MRSGARLSAVAAALAAAAVLGAPASAAPTTPPTLKIEVVGQGTVTGTGISCGLGSLSCYSAYGSTAAVALTAATTASGWSFSHWEDGCSGSTASCSATPGTNATATAVFTTTGAVQTSTLDVSSTDGDVANGSASYPIECDSSATAPAGTSCSLTALTGSTLSMTEAPDSGYLFAGWGGACTGTGPSCAVYLQSTQSVGASFAATASNALSVTVSGNGSVGGGGISCGAGATCSAPEPSTATVTLTASPQSGWVLSAWSGACTGQQSTCTVQMSAAASVTATFVQQTTLQVTVSGDGYVSGGGIGCDGGQTCSAGEIPGNVVTLTAHPSSGGTVLWSGCTTSAGTLCTVTVGTGVQSVTATLGGGSGTTPPVASNSLTVDVTGDGYVTATAGSATIYCTAAGGAGCTANVAAGTTITINAVPASGLAGNFTSWTGDCTGFTTTSCTLTMNGAKSVGALFAGGDTTYVLTAQAAGSGSITGAGLDCTGTGGIGCSAAQAAGAAVTLTAAPNFGETFAGWSGACSGTASTCTVTMTLAKSVTATFKASSPGTQSLTLEVSGAGEVSASGGTCSSTSGKTKLCSQSYSSGKEVALTAKAAAGSVFAGWKGACTGVKKTCTVTLSSFAQVTATFARPLLAATRKPAVAKTSKGYRVTLFFAVHEHGSLRLVGTLAKRRIVSRSSKVAAGSRRLVVTVGKRGRYVFTLTLAASGKHSVRWAVRV